jgi:hypothetical protein
MLPKYNSGDAKIIETKKKRKQSKNHKVDSLQDLTDARTYVMRKPMLLCFTIIIFVISLFSICGVLLYAIIKKLDVSSGGMIALLTILYGAFASTKEVLFSSHQNIGIPFIGSKDSKKIKK